MSTTSTRPLFWIPMLAACTGTAGLMFFHSAQASSTASQAAKAQYQIERQACLRGQSGQDTATCLKEAGAALAEAQRATLNTGESEETLRRNALARCERVAEDDKAACRRMVRGEGSRSGSVKGGGVMTELTTVVPAAPAASSPP